MSGPIKTVIALLIVGTIGIVTLSCGSPQTQRTRQDQVTEAPESAADANGVRLTRQQVIEIANAEIRRNGLNPADYDVIFDQSNVAWNSVLRSVRLTLPELEGHDYQAIKYTPRGHKAQGADLFVFVDRNTGKALLFLQVGG